jgi:hypothetical protein
MQYQIQSRRPRTRDVVLPELANARNSRKPRRPHTRHRGIWQPRRVHRSPPRRAVQDGPRDDVTLRSPQSAGASSPEPDLRGRRGHSWPFDFDQLVPTGGRVTALMRGDELVPLSATFLTRRPGRCRSRAGGLAGLPSCCGHRPMPASHSATTRSTTLHRTDLALRQTSLLGPVADIRCHEDCAEPVAGRFGPKSLRRPMIDRMRWR